MPKFTVIEGTKPPDSQVEQVKQRIRKTKVPDIPQCVCGSRTMIEVNTAGTKQRACAMCFMNGRLVLV